MATDSVKLRINGNHFYLLSNKCIEVINSNRSDRRLFVCRKFPIFQFKQRRYQRDYY